MSDHSKIKVILGTSFKREAVLINPGISAAEPVFNEQNPSTISEAPNNVIATGETSRSILKKLYGR
jgi:hypothetical protein